MSKTVLVTGGAGFVGSHACKALAAAGYLPVTYDSLETGHEWAVKWGPLEKGDLLDRKRLREVLGKHSPHAVLHFAAYISVAESVAEPERYHRNNVVGSQCLVEAMAEHGIAHLVFSSSAAVYGTPERLPLTESHPLKPINPYGENKRLVEMMLRDAERARGLRSVSLRYFNAAGADPEGEIGEGHHPETHLIPLVVQAALGQRPAVQIFGTDYPTTDGTCIRDYVHVADLAEAHVLALRYLAAGGASQSFNVGTGEGCTVREVVAAVEKVSGRKVPVALAARRAGDPAGLVADATLIGQTLSWKPRFPHLEAQVEHAWRWLSSRAAR
jgi:UDP-arabinose 4-epimerase